MIKCTGCITENIFYTTAYVLGMGNEEDVAEQSINDGKLEVQNIWLD